MFDNKKNRTREITMSKKKKTKTTLAKKKIKVKKIIKPSRMTVQIRESTPAPYVSRFFKNEWEEAKKAMFFR